MLSLLPLPLPLPRSLSLSLLSVDLFLVANVNTTCTAFLLHVRVIGLMDGCVAVRGLHLRLRLPSPLSSPVLQRCAHLHESV
jgi:hypothetical protein